jgi:hypothetical protein
MVQRHEPMTSFSDARRAPVASAAAATSVVERPSAPAVASGRLSGLDRLWRVTWRPGAIYLVSRAIVVLTMGVVAVIGGGSLGGRIYRWDSVWYLRASGAPWSLHGRAMAGGYPSHLPMFDGHVAANAIAFFPGLPLLIRGLSGLTGMSLFSAGVAISSITGLTATIGVWALVREYAGERTANRATILFALFPGSFVFSMIYSEGLVITGAAFGLLALMRRKWILAGLLGLVATAAAPIALAFVICCAWAAVGAIRRDRDWRSLAAPILAPLGTLVYLVWIWQHTGVVSAFSRTERGGWRSFLSIAYPFRIIGRYLRDPVASHANDTLVFFCIIAVVVAVVIGLRDRQPSLLMLYGAAVGALAILTAPVGPRPRIILDAFPLILAVAVRYQAGWKYRLAVGLSGVLLVAFTAYEVGSFAVFP